MSPMFLDPLSQRLQQAGGTLRAWLRGWWQLIFLGAQILVLALSPSSYTALVRERIAQQMVGSTAAMLLWFSAFAALVTVVLTRIVVVTAQSYGLTQYALQVVIRVLVIELIPLCAVLFVALRMTMAGAAALTLPRSAEGQAVGRPDKDVLLTQALPRVLAGIHASLSLAALSCVVATVLAYVAVYGASLAALPGYTRLFGQVFNPAVTLVFVVKTLLFSLAVALLPVTAALYDRQQAADGARRELNILARLFMVLLLIEVLCLVGNYY